MRLWCIWRTELSLCMGRPRQKLNIAVAIPAKAWAGILVRTPSGELRAFSATCTHLNCIVQYRDDIGHIWCACHNGHFDLNGLNISGPPPAPLEAYTVNVREDEIVVSRGV